jgi:hypothetical protein
MEAGIKERNCSFVRASPPKMFIYQRKPTSETPWFGDRGLTATVIAAA